MKLAFKLVLYLILVSAIFLMLYFGCEDLAYPDEVNDYRICEVKVCTKLEDSVCSICYRYFHSGPCNHILGKLYFMDKLEDKDRENRTVLCVDGHNAQQFWLRNLEKRLTKLENKDEENNNNNNPSVGLFMPKFGMRATGFGGQR